MQVLASLLLARGSIPGPVARLEEVLEVGPALAGLLRFGGTRGACPRWESGWCTLCMGRCAVQEFDATQRKRRSMPPTYRNLKRVSKHHSPLGVLECQVLMGATRLSTTHFSTKGHGSCSMLWLM